MRAQIHREMVECLHVLIKFLNQIKNFSLCTYFDPKKHCLKRQNLHFSILYVNILFSVDAKLYRSNWPQNFSKIEDFSHTVLSQDSWLSKRSKTANLFRKFGHSTISLCISVCVYEVCNLNLISLLFGGCPFLTQRKVKQQKERWRLGYWSVKLLKFSLVSFG